MKLDKSSKTKRYQPKDKFQYQKDGSIKKDGKKLTTAYEKKYSTEILHGYIVAKDNTIRNKRGQFITKKQQAKYKKVREITEQKRDKKVAKREITKTDVDKGRFMSKSLALTYECTCYVRDDNATNPEDKFGHIITHYYTISSNKSLTYEQAIKKHNNHYPSHDLLNITHTSTKALSFD